MMRIRKVYNAKIVAVIVASVFLCNAIGSSSILEDSSRPELNWDILTLRIPLAGCQDISDFLYFFGYVYRVQDRILREYLENKEEGVKKWLREKFSDRMLHRPIAAFNTVSYIMAGIAGLNEQTDIIHVSIDENYNIWIFHKEMDLCFVITPKAQKKKFDFYSLSAEESEDILRDAFLDNEIKKRILDELEDNPKRWNIAAKALKDNSHAGELKEMLMSLLREERLDALARVLKDNPDAGELREVVIKALEEKLFPEIKTTLQDLLMKKIITELIDKVSAALEIEKEEAEKIVRVPEMEIEEAKKQVSYEEFQMFSKGAKALSLAYHILKTQLVYSSYTDYPDEEEKKVEIIEKIRFVNILGEAERLWLLKDILIDDPLIDDLTKQHFIKILQPIDILTIGGSLLDKERSLIRRFLRLHDYIDLNIIEGLIDIFEKAVENGIYEQKQVFLIEDFLNACSAFIDQALEEIYRTYKIYRLAYDPDEAFFLDETYRTYGIYKPNEIYEIDEIYGIKEMYTTKEIYVFNENNRKKMAKSIEKVIARLGSLVYDDYEKASILRSIVPKGYIEEYYINLEFIYYLKTGI
jgi:hypothetical protein